MPDLVAQRRVYLSRGYAYVSQKDLASLVVQDFRTQLSKVGGGWRYGGSRAGQGAEGKMGYEVSGLEILVQDVATQLSRCCEEQQQMRTEVLQEERLGRVTEEPGCWKAALQTESSVPSIIAASIALHFVLACRDCVAFPLGYPVLIVLPEASPHSPTPNRASPPSTGAGGRCSLTPTCA